jgi:branched-chain amino acid transport system ATP-binding protein
MNTFLLEGRGLSKHYGGVMAVQGVDINLSRGEVLGLVGPNGAGKTTLVDVIAGTQSADAGDLSLNGMRLHGSPARRARAGLARTFQHPLLAQSLTVRENLLVGRSGIAHSSPLQILKGIVLGILRPTNLPDQNAVTLLAGDVGLHELNRLVRNLTLGEQRLVEVGRALGQDPLVMLLDEPFAGADSSGIRAIVEVVRTVRSRGHGVILIDHNIDIVSTLVDRIMLMDQGRVMFDGPPAACLTSPQMKLVYFGSSAS